MGTLKKFSSALKNSFQIQNYVYVEYGDRKSCVLTLVKLKFMMQLEFR